MTARARPRPGWTAPRTRLFRGRPARIVAAIVVTAAVLALSTALIDGAIRLVALGGARSVQLSGLDPDEMTLHTGAAHAQVDGVAFRIERRGSRSLTFIIGPRSADVRALPDERRR